MQIGLIRLVKKYFENAQVAVVTVFGANQVQDIRDEFDHTLTTDVALLGGLKPTFYPLQKGTTRSELAIELLNATAFLFSVLVIFFARILPTSWVAFLLPMNFKKTFLTLHEADLIIWNGRNFRSRKNPLLELYRMYNLLFHPLVCIALSKKMVCIGGSVWNLNSAITRWLLRFVFARCTFVSMREERSFQVAQKLMGNNTSTVMQQLPDLSFAAMKTVTRQPTGKVNVSDTNYPVKVGITLVDWRSDGSAIRENYKKVMSECIQRLIENGSEVFLIPQVTKKWENFEEIYEEVLNTLDPQQRGKITIIEGEPMIEELQDIYLGLDLLVATRMHSAIFSATVGTPVIAIAYDSGGKWGILEKIGLGDYIIPYKQVTTDKLLKMIAKFWKEKHRIMLQVKQKTDQHLADVDLNVRTIASNV